MSKLRVFVAAGVCAALMLVPATAAAAGTGSIAGTVVGPNAEPLSQVWVCAYRAEAVEFEENCAETDAEGDYAVTALQAGSYKVEFWPQSSAPSYVAELYDDTRDWEAATAVPVQEGQVTVGIDASLALGATVEGQVLADPLGVPVEFGVACAMPLDGSQPTCAPLAPDGTYRLIGIPAGDYRVQFAAASNIYNLLNQFWDHREQFEEANILTLTGGEVRTGIDADLQPGSEVRGTVYSRTGVPLEGVIVGVIFGGENWPKGWVTTDSEGRYSIFAIPKGTWRVGFSLEPRPEFFGLEPVPEEIDGYRTQFWKNKPTLGHADLFTLDPPQVKSGVDAYLNRERGRRQPPRPGAPLNSTLALPSALGLPQSGNPADCPAGSRLTATASGRHCLQRSRGGSSPPRP